MHLNFRVKDCRRRFGWSGAKAWHFLCLVTVNWTSRPTTTKRWTTDWLKPPGKYD